MRLASTGGYLLLIFLAILAPSPLPIPLDGIILGLIRLGYNPTLIIFLALVGDIIGTFLIFLLGKKGRGLYSQYIKRRKRRDYIAAEKLFHRYGKYSLLLSGVPFLGDALIFIAGFYRLNFKTFLLWFISGKLLWYGLVIIPITTIGRHSFSFIPSLFLLKKL